MSIIVMNLQERREILSAVRLRFLVVDPYLTEQNRRIWAAAEATALGPSGNAIVSEGTGISRTTITKARSELQQASDLPPSRQRQAGGGRKPLREGDPTFFADLA